MSKYAGSLYYSFGIAADLSASQWRGVIINGNEQVAARATVTILSGAVAGILQNAPNTSTQMARVCMLGSSKLELGDSIAAGASFLFNTIGVGIPVNATTAGAQILGGIALEGYTGASVTGGLIEAFLRIDRAVDSVTVS